MIVNQTANLWVELIDQIGGRHAMCVFDDSSDALQEGSNITASIVLGLITLTPRRVSPWWVLRRTLGLACQSVDVSTTLPFISNHLASTGCSASP
jgi:hypothetical protein